MQSINRELFAASPTLRVRDVVLSVTDDLETQREKFARVVFDEMYEFVGLLDVNGTRLKSTARRLREPVSPISEGAPHGLFIPYLERLNRDLLAFVKGS